MVFVKSHIPSRRLDDFKIPSNIEIILFEINLRKKKWLVVSIHNIPTQKNKYFLWYLKNLLKFYWTRYEKVIILCDFNVEAENKVMKDFLLEISSKVDGGSCIDLLITNSKFSFMTTNSLETGLSDHHHIYYSQNKIWKFGKPLKVAHDHRDWTLTRRRLSWLKLLWELKTGSRGLRAEAGYEGWGPGTRKLNHPKTNGVDKNLNRITLK